MRRVLATLSIAVLLGATAQSTCAQGKGFADPLCPSAVPAVKAISAITDPSDAVKVADAVNTAVRAYKDCAASALASGAIEPQAHYAQTRAAAYEVIYGRALLKQTRYDEAHAAFEDASKLSGLVADWVAPAYGYSSSNKNPETGAAAGTATRSGDAPNAGGAEHNAGAQNKSQFRDSANDVRKAALEELAKLVPVPSPKP
jgi:hypothetical protein